MLASRSPLVAQAAYDPRTRTASFRIQLPLERLSPGRYTLQAVSIVVGTPWAAFSRAFLAVVPPQTAGAPGPASAEGVPGS